MNGLVQTISANPSAASTLLMISIGVLAVAAIYAYKETQKVEKLEKGPQSALHQAQEIIQASQEKALEILKKTQEEASAMLANTASAKEEIDKGTKIALEHATDQYLSMMQAEARDLVTSYKELFVNTMDKHIKDAEAMLVQTQKESTSHLTTRIDQEFEKARVEIEAYKASRLAKIESQVDALVSELAKDVLGRSLSRQDHKDLIIAALEEAKKSKSFDF